MYGMSPDGTTWILTLVMIGLAGTAWGVLALGGHAVSEFARVRIARHQAAAAIANQETADRQHLRQVSIQAVEEMKNREQDQTSS